MTTKTAGLLLIIPISLITVFVVIYLLMNPPDPSEPLNIAESVKGSYPAILNWGCSLFAGASLLMNKRLGWVVAHYVIAINLILPIRYFYRLLTGYYDFSIGTDDLVIYPIFVGLIHLFGYFIMFRKLKSNWILTRAEQVALGILSIATALVFLAI